MTRRPDYADFYSPPSPGWRPRWWNRLACWCDNRLQIARIWQKLNEMEARMSSAEQEQYDRGAQLVGLVKAEFASVHKQLEDALADQEAKTGAAVEGALTADSLTDAQRIKELLDELAEVLPGTVPDVPVPDPGQPAELPAEVPAEVPAEGDSGTGGDAGSVPDEPANG